ncbi:MAG TPA: hemolysin-type calcium-binding protein, partial [Cyanobacteria bacterium UBA8553]|nr:hemolysin-type calcium-binding protein [Cyanobacteria bacterium UBA8553]
MIRGTSGNDTLTGTNAGDKIRGGLGADYLDGKAGADTYVFKRGDGQDTLDDSSTDASVDKLMFFGRGLTSTNAIVTRIGSSSDLKISFAGTTDSVVLK